MQDAIEKIFAELNRLQALKAMKLETVRAKLSMIRYYDGSISAAKYALEVLGVKVRMNPNTLYYERVDEVEG